MRLSCTLAVPATEPWEAAAKHWDNRSHRKRDKINQAQRLFVIAEPQMAPKSSATHQSLSDDKELVQQVLSLLGQATPRLFALPSPVLAADMPTFFGFTWGALYLLAMATWEVGAVTRETCHLHQAGTKASVCTDENLCPHRMFWLPCSSLQLHFLPHPEVLARAKLGSVLYSKSIVDWS